MANRLGDVVRTPGKKSPGQRNKGIARTVRLAKGIEADLRNSRTPIERTKQYRKQNMPEIGTDAALLLLHDIFSEAGTSRENRERIDRISI